jgi:hypothetical protein
MLRRGGVNSVLRNVKLRGRRAGSFFYVVIAGKKYTEPREISKNQRANGSFVRLAVIAPGKINIFVAAKMPPIGSQERTHTDSCCGGRRLKRNAGGVGLSIKEFLASIIRTEIVRIIN